MKGYLTWGIGYGKSKELAQINAQLAANLDKIKVLKLESLKLGNCEVIEGKERLKELKGSFRGIVLQNCTKGEAAVALVLGALDGQLFIGHGKAGSAAKAEKKAQYNLKLLTSGKEPEQDWRVVAHAPPIKNNYACAIVAFVVED